MALIATYLKPVFQQKNNRNSSSEFLFSRRYFVVLIFTLALQWGTFVNGQVNITPIRTDVSGFGTWTDVNITGTSYLQLLSSSSTTSSPAMNFDNYTGESLNFKARTYGGISGTSNVIYIDYYNGSSWINITTRTPSSSSLTAMTQVDLSPYNGTAIQIRFRVPGATGTIGAGIDDISITGTLITSCTSQTISFGALATKTYGDADFAPGGIASSGLSVSYSSSNTAVATIVGGNIHIVGAGTSTITASQAGDATYCAATNVLQTLTVNPKTLTVTGASASNKTYDGTNAATISGSLSGIVGGDGVTLNGTGTFASTNVGTGISVTSTSTLSGAQAANYTLTQPTGLSANITAKALTITANDVSKVFGTTLTGGSGSTAFTSGGLVGGQTIGSVTIAYGTGAAAGDAVGTYANQVTASAATGGTFTASNYSISYTAGTITVNAVPTIFISEFAGWGYAGDFNDEYFEITNTGVSSQSLAGWTLEYYNSSGVLEGGAQNLTGSIGSNSAYLIAARTTGGAINGVTPDFSCSGIAMNTTGWVVLKDGSGTIIDQAGATGDRFADAKNYEFTNCTGDNLPVSNWDDLGSGNGTPGVVNCAITCTTPTTQAYNINFSSVYATTMIVGWTNGNGTYRAVFMKEGSGAITNPSDGTSYTASSDWSAKGTQLGASGYYCIYNGTGTSVNLTNLLPSTTYYVQVFEYNCTGASSLYYTSTATNNPNNQTTNAATSNASDIIRNGSFTEPTNIAYASYQEANLTSSSLEVAKFTLRDGGSTTDGDALGTTLTDITFTVSNSAYLRRIAIYDGATEIAEAASTTPLTFNGLNLNAGDGGTKDFSIRASFASTVVDNAQFQFTVSAATASGSGSTFAAANAGGASSSIAGDNNRIEVVATKLRFTQQPSNTSLNASMSPSVTVAASDALNNNDQDYPGSVSITSTGTLSGSPVSAALSSGVSTFSTLTHTVAGTGYTLSATLSPLTGATSGTFDITTFTYLAGDYRTTAAGASFASTTSWETYNGSSWSAASVAPETTAPSRIIVRHSGISAGTNGAYSYNDITILSGGELLVQDVSYTSSIYFVSAGKTLEVQNGGILRLTGFMNMSSSANFILRDGSYFYLNNASLENLANDVKEGRHWNGIENFEDNSTVVVQNINNTSSATVRSFLRPSPYQITPNAGGNAMIGNLIYDFTPVTNDQTILPALTGSLYFCNNLTIINHSSTKSIAITANKVQSPVAIINGNLTIEQGYVIIGTNYTANALQKITVRGNLDIQNANPANPSNVYIHSMTGTGLALIKMWFYLEGNLTVANGASLTTGYDAQSTDHSMLYFLGTNAQTINGAGTINLSNVAIQKGSGNVTVTLNRDITVNDTLQFDAGQFVIGNHTLTNGLSGTMGHQIGGSSSSYVVSDGSGTYTRTQLTTGTSHLFPVGPSTSSYNPATINYSGSVDNFSLRVSPQLLENGTTGNPFTTGVVDRTWHISEETPGGTTASVTLQWNGSEELSLNRSSCYVSHYASAWDEITGTSASGSGPYTQTRTGMTSFSPHGIKNKEASLPIDLLFFNAKQFGEQIDLEWATASETNNDYFSLERSMNGIDFSEIGTVKGSGNTNELNNYLYTDYSPSTGNSYYRLKQVDFDGNYSYSNIVSVYFGSDSFIGFSNFISNAESISFNVNNSDFSPFSVQIFDITGKVIYFSSYHEMSEDVSVVISSSGFVPGIYCLVLSNNNKFTTSKFILK